ncbi:argininosuccinate lyase, partial [Gemmatimonadota bacterium]
CHDLVGNLVREAEERGIPLSELPLAVYQGTHEAFQEDVREVFSWERSVEARSSVGGTAREAVLFQLSAARGALSS